MFIRLRSFEFIAFHFLFILLSDGHGPRVSFAFSFFGSGPEEDEHQDPLFAEMKAELASQGSCWTYAVRRLEATRWTRFFVNSYEYHRTFHYSSIHKSPHFRFDDFIPMSRNSSSSQERLAFDFMNCFLEGAGVPQYYCRESKDLSECSDFLRMHKGPHGHVYAVFYLQSQLVVAYLRELARQKQVSRQLTTLSDGPSEVEEKHSHISDILLESIQTKGGNSLFLYICILYMW